MLPVLYSFRRCPYAMRARLALAASGIRCELREIVLRDKPASMLQASPKGTVPVLVLSDGTVVDESLDIMLWALTRHDPYSWLQPEGGSLDDALALIAQCEQEFKPALDRYKYPDRYENADPAVYHDRCVEWLKGLEDRLNAHSSEPQAVASLLGVRASLADAAIMPFVRQFAQVDRAWFDAQPWKALSQWLEAWLASSLFERVMVKQPVWDGGQQVTFP